MSQEVPKIVPWCAAKSEERRVKLINGQLFRLSNGSRVQVFRMDGEEGIAVRLFKPMADGQTSLLEFGLSEEAAAALCKGLIHLFQPKNLPKE